VRGDNLWKLAEKYYGHGRDWKVIMDANAGIKERDLVIGSTLKIPAR
ncbi:LysM peptidoglycan-binding domain-containing protein, partial [Salmonella enterica subsp. enterica]|nr:LysM peptidoglycan-binding domain-containing protein [Salmonella enterica subsp. enterica serovar Enteritidis]